MASAAYKLIYFNVRARAEPIRLLFHAAGVPFDDKRIDSKEWPKMKPSIPGGRLPVLLVTKEGEKPKFYDESMAIARLFARKFNLLGNTDEEFYKIERLIGQCGDLDREMINIFCADKERKSQLTEQFTEKFAPNIVKLICQSLTESGGDFLLGSKLSFGDLYLMSTMDQVNVVAPHLLDEKCAPIQSNRDAVLRDRPNVQTYLKGRPVSLL
ncbi:unnamed protein product [Calicophoron daubneyi]|uniref:Glutathione transferase n=1 Tax=Calicophoron daubneyi TaxID=300641 RepID=A0AAV2TI48_CALDB